MSNTRQKNIDSLLRLLSRKHSVLSGTEADEVPGETGGIFICLAIPIKHMSKKTKHEFKQLMEKIIKNSALEFRRDDQFRESLSISYSSKEADENPDVKYIRSLVSEVNKLKQGLQKADEKTKEGVVSEVFKRHRVPDEISSHISFFLSREDAARLAQVDKKIYKATKKIEKGEMKKFEDEAKKPQKKDKKSKHTNDAEYKTPKPGSGAA